MRPSESQLLHDFTHSSKLRDLKHVRHPTSAGLFWLPYLVGVVSAVLLAIGYGHLSSNDDAVIAPKVCESPRFGEILHESEADGTLTCFYVRKVAGIRPTVRSTQGK